MRILFHKSEPPLTQREKQIISATLQAHYRIMVISLAKQRIPEAEAVGRAIAEVARFAKDTFDDIAIEILPEADQ